MARLMSFAKTSQQLLNGTKTVTRRDGWLFLKSCDLFEAIEWPARWGKRWVCEECHWVGDTPATASGGRGWECPKCGVSWRASPVFRKPRRLGLYRVRSVCRETLGSITSAEVAREGFPGKSPGWLIELYCKPKQPDPERMVTRIEFEPWQE